MVHCFLAPHAIPSPLPGTDLQSLSLSTQPLPEHVRLWCPGHWFRLLSVRLSLCFAVLSPSAVLFCDFEVPLTQLIFLSVRWLPRMWVPFLLYSCLGNATLVLIPFLSLFLFCSTQLCQEFLALFGCLSSSASIQLMFCLSHFTCRCVFFICLWEKMSLNSYFSTILLCPSIQDILICMIHSSSRKKLRGVPTVAQQDWLHLCSSRTQV